MDFLNKDFAVLLNDNARKVSSKVMRKVADIIPKTHLYYTRTVDEATVVLEDLVKKRVQTLFCGGGDGTLVHMLSNLKKIIDDLSHRDHIIYNPPKIVPLKLGTGNGMAGFLGIKKGLEPLWNYISAARARLTRFNLIEFEDKVCHFAGLGWDAAILNDYILFKQKFSMGLAKHWMNGLGGYLTSLFFKTVPEQVLRRNRPSLKVLTEGPVYEISTNKPPKLIEPPNGILYEGPCNVAGVATVPEYGFRLKAFPFARTKEGFMNLRIVKAGVLELLVNWRPIWMGKWESNNLKDYLAQKVEMVFDRPMPLQIGGDALGYMDRVNFAVSGFSVDVIAP